jgi:chromosome segregation ATPase
MKLLCRQREGDVELQSLRVAVSEYEGKFKAFESQRESFSYRETQFQQEINRLANQTKLLQAEIERMSEFTQKK